MAPWPAPSIFGLLTPHAHRCERAVLRTAFTPACGHPVLDSHLELSVLRLAGVERVRRLLEVGHQRAFGGGGREQPAGSIPQQPRRVLGGVGLACACHVMM